LPRTPAVQWSVTPIIRFWRVTANVSFRTRGASWADANNAQRVPPTTVLNSNISILIGRDTTITFTGRNLTDEIVVNRGGIVTGATTARIGLPRNYGVQITRSWTGG
jgi:hypothetical protein